MRERARESGQANRLPVTLDLPRSRPLLQLWLLVWPPPHRRLSMASTRLRNFFLLLLFLFPSLLLFFAFFKERSSGHPLFALCSISITSSKGNPTGIKSTLV